MSLHTLQRSNSRSGGLVLAVPLSPLSEELLVTPVTHQTEGMMHYVYYFIVLIFHFRFLTFLYYLRMNYFIITLFSVLLNTYAGYFCN